jgi:hypothetical protein
MLLSTRRDALKVTSFVSGRLLVRLLLSASERSQLQSSREIRIHSSLAARFILLALRPLFDALHKFVNQQVQV